ncbi:hypothetical protein [Nonomuraea sp. SYSU D8015]|uniref:hypothetical protein n=1 Tax=Nonomuraea sp. SYSU D8015 TaxID=2593644 RepID=UPI001660A1D2|nr:hypothetical protein [Nonomuraea sp. SYSU D8015]
MQGTSPVPDAAPAVEGGGQATGGAAPAVEGSSPVIEGGEPTIVDTSPGTAGTSPGTAGTSPGATGAGPAIGDASPAIEGAGPAAQDTAPKVGAQPGSNRPVIPPRLVWRLATPSPSAARMARDWQTWRFLPDKRLSRYYPTGTWTVTATATGKGGATVTEYAAFQLKREARLSSVRVEQARGAVRLRGSLTRVDPRGLTDYGPFGRQRLEILWRPDTASSWEQVGETTTDAAGAFVTTIPGRTAGHWRVRYTGTEHYAPDASKSQQITG